jgi:uncharacterized protein
MSTQFEFDPAKSAANLAKHGIDFEQAQALWDRNDWVEVAARAGSGDESRRAVIGLIADRCWTAIITRRDAVIRMISVRRSRKEEVALYEDQDFGRGV